MVFQHFHVWYFFRYYRKPWTLEVKSGCWVGKSFLGILGYSDDNFLLAPYREALQVMLKICEKYAEEHGLKFSTDSDPKKSKTRCLAFLQKERYVKSVELCGNKLPWVTSCKHLGNTIVSKVGSDIRSQDIRKKRAAFNRSIILWNSLPGERKLNLYMHTHFLHVSILFLCDTL